MAGLALLGCSKNPDEPTAAVRQGLAKQEAAAALPSSQAPESKTPTGSEPSANPEGAVQEAPLALPDYMHTLRFDSVASYPSAVAVSSDGAVAAHIALDGTIVVWDARTFEVLENILPGGEGAGRPGALALSADGGLLAIGRFDSVVVVRSRHETKTMRELRGHSGAISALAFSPDGRLLASGGDDATSLVWDVGTGQRLHAFDSPTGIVVGLGFSGDARALVVNKWINGQYGAERQTTLWDLDEGIDIGTRNVASSGDEVMRSGQAVGANNWLLAYTTREGLEVERLDTCDKSRIAGPAVAENTPKTGDYASTVAADPQGRWVAALDEHYKQQLLFYATSGDAAAVSLQLPVRSIALVPHPDGKTLFALAFKEAHKNRDRFVVGDLETVTAGTLHAITIPEALQQSPPLAVKPNAIRCLPSAASRKYWPYHLPDSVRALPVTARLEPPGELPSPKAHDEQRFNPVNSLYFAGDGTLYVLHHAETEAQSGVVVWNPATKRALRSHFQAHVDGPVFRLREGWAAQRSGQLLDFLTGNLLLDSAANALTVDFATDPETGEIYRIVEGRVESYGADAKPRPLATREGLPVVTVAARNGNLAIMYADGAGEVWNTRTGKSWPFKSVFGVEKDCAIQPYRPLLLSADGQFLQFYWGCGGGDAPDWCSITDLRNAAHAKIGHMLAPFPKRSARVIVPAELDHLDVWDTAKNELFVRLPRHSRRDKEATPQNVLAAISDDGRLVATVLPDGLVRVWDIDAKRVVGEATISGGITAMAFDGVGRSLAVGAASGKVLILDTTGKPVASKTQ